MSPVFNRGASVRVTQVGQGESRAIDERTVLVDIVANAMRTQEHVQKFCRRLESKQILDVCRYEQLLKALFYNPKKAGISTNLGICQTSSDRLFIDRVGVESVGVGVKTGER